MSFNRRHEDSKRGKVNNLVSKHDFNKGGVHGKSTKAKRTNFKQSLQQYDLDELLDDEFADLENEDYI